MEFKDEISVDYMIEEGCMYGQSFFMQFGISCIFCGDIGFEED